jgi:hypothetical protein
MSNCNSTSEPWKVNKFIPDSPYPESDARHPHFNQRMQEALAQQEQERVKVIANNLMVERATPDPEDSEKPEQHLWRLPQGLMGTTAEFIHASAYRPNQEVALAGSMAFLAGIVGRQYNTSTATGLNQYIALLAETSRGKEGAATGIGKLVKAIKVNRFEKYMPLDLDRFLGPSTIASAPALKKHLAGVSQCFYVHIGELGKMLQKMTARNASPIDNELMGCLMDLFMKSGQHSSLRATIYSDMKMNIPEIQSPCVSIIGDSTPDEFYKAMTLSDFASGLLPRFTIIEHKGGIPAKNKLTVLPSNELVGQLVNMIRTVIQLEQENKVISVVMDKQAEQFADDFEADYEKRIEKESGPLAQLWSRSHLRLLRLSSLIAVGSIDWSHEQANYSEVIPTVTLPMVEWAAGLIQRSNALVERRLESGGIGEKQDAEEQRQVIESCIRKFIKSKYKTTWEASYGITADMHLTGRISYRYIRNATINNKCFARYDYGKTVYSILKMLEAAEHIKQLNVTSRSNNGAISTHFQVLTVEGLYRG